MCSLAYHFSAAQLHCGKPFLIASSGAISPIRRLAGFLGVLGGVCNANCEIRVHIASNTSRRLAGFLGVLGGVCNANYEIRAVCNAIF